MKTLTVLVGPMGIGKTTYSKKLSGYRISGDEMGQKEHFINYEKALVRSEGHIIIDKTNPTRENRRRYISLAKQHGYKTTILEFFQPYSVCFESCLKRENHPTLPQDKSVIRKALDMYFTQYETILDSEADVIVRSKNNPMVLDLTNEFNKAKRTLVFGDLHGCYTELETSLKEVGYNSLSDLLIGCGDFADRGPQIKECYLHLNYSVQGNHDNKFLRYLRGNKVNTESIKDTIEQTKHLDQEELYLHLMDKMCYAIIKFSNNYVTHAGFQPHKHPSNTSREFSMYARKYDLATRTFTNNNSCPYWYEVKRDYPMFNLFFGHEVHEDKSQVADGIYAMDAGCVFGNALRMAIIENNEITFKETKSLQPKIKEKDMTWDFINKFEPYDQLVSQGYLRKQEQGDLVLYNYTEQCTYNKHWNKYTMECRGLILNKITGETVARPFPKFFNLGELESPNMPDMPINESYQVYEKVDGSLGILYVDPSDNVCKIATRGSFQSDQAKKGTEIFHRERMDMPSYAQMYTEMIRIKPYLADYTLLFEIIYPENRVNDGARLVCDYGTKETLILLGGINKFTGKDLEYKDLVTIGYWTNLIIVNKFDYKIEDLIKMKETIPKTEEGWVVRFDSGFRIKIKGDEYCRFQKIINGITPLNIWEVMLNTDKFELPYDYKKEIPEEILKEAEIIETKLFNTYLYATGKAYNEYEGAIIYAKLYHSDKLERGLGLYIKQNHETLTYPKTIFSIYKNDLQSLKKTIRMSIRPTGNKL